MKNKRKDDGYGCGVFIGIILVIALLANWTESNLEFWLSKINGHPVDVSYIVALVLSVFTNIFGLTFNIISELLKIYI